MVRRACVHMSAAHCLVFRPSPPPPPTKGGSPACALPGHCLTACAPGDWSSMFCLQCHFNKHKHRCVAGHMLSLTFSVRLCVRKIRLRGCVYLGPATARLPRGAPYTPTPAPTHTSGHAPCGGAAQSTTGLHPGVRHRTQGTQGGSFAQRLCSTTAPAGTHTRMPGAVRHARPHKCWPSFGTSDMYNDSESQDYASWYLRRAAVCQACVSSNSPGRQAPSNLYFTAEEVKVWKVPAPPGPQVRDNEGLGEVTCQGHW